MASPVTTYGSGGFSIRWGEHSAHGTEGDDGTWQVVIDGEELEGAWPTQDAAEDAANDRLRRIAGPNAAREGSRFGEG